MRSPKFWRECCENGLDPLWAYRYLRWRLGHPRLNDWRLLNDIPGPKGCIEATLNYIKEEWVDNDDGSALKAALNYYTDKIKMTGTSFGHWPMRPSVCGWKNGVCL